MPTLDGNDPDAIARAARRLADGELVAFPTETVYGLGADATQDAAVRRIYTTKGRPADHPLIVHVESVRRVDVFAAEVPAFAERLIQTFWPGPLTLILPRRPGVAEMAAGGHPSIGLRCPAHPVAQALLAACAALPRPVPGLAGPSANRFGRISPTAASHVADEFGPGLWVLDGGPCPVGVESAIVDCTRGAPVLLRPGVLSREAISAAAGQPLADRLPLATPAPRAAGTLAAHYAPRARLRLMDARQLQAALDVLGDDVARIAVYARSPLKARSSALLLRRMPDDAQVAAQQLYAALRALDDAGVALIWVETPPAGAEWEAVRDRLGRAAASG